MLAVGILLFQALLVFGLCMTAFRLRGTFGFAPLFFTLGALECMKYFAVAQMLVDVPRLGMVFPGSVVFYVSSVAIALVVYAREGIAPARQLMWSMVYVNFTVSVLSLTFYELVKLPNVKPLVNFDPALFSITAWWNIVGTVLLVLGVISSFFLFNWLGRFRLPLFLSIGLTVAIVACADSFLFFFGTNGFGWPKQPILFSNMLGKAVAAFCFAGMAHIYLRYLDARHSGEMGSPALAGGALLAALTYQRQIKDLERELQRDALTGALNRRYLEQALPEQLALDKLRDESTALLLLDLDHFKAINDTHGHLVGDEVLKHVVTETTKQLRRGDSLARLGGEEFVAVLPSTNASEAHALAERIRASLAELLVQTQGSALKISATLGIAIAPEDGTALNALLKVADDRLYKGKHDGRNRVVGAL